MKIPRDFKLGVADADLQVIGERSSIEKEGGCRSMWTEFAERSGKVAGNHTPLEGIDRYGRFEEDARIIGELGTRHYRTSVSMSRLLTSSGDVNGNAVKWYRTYFERLRKAGVSLYVTLYHWELPQHLAERGGWHNPETIDWYLRHVQATHEHLGDLISEYFLFNEPWVIGFVAHYLGIHAPGETSLPGALEVIHHVLLAQGRGARLLRTLAPGTPIGTVYNLIPTYARDDSDENRRAAVLADCYYNRWFLDPLYFGEYPAPLLERWEAFVPRFTASDLAEICVGGELDSFGINYYGGSLVVAKDESDLGFEGAGRQFHFKNQLGWSMFIPPAYPWGLHELLLKLYGRYERAGMRRIYISENGTAWKSEVRSDGTIEDEYRKFYLHQHLEQVVRAARSGVPVEGYFLWTLMDNYEWAEGYRPEACFGIVHVDRETFERVPKASFDWYRELIRTGVLTTPL